MRQSQRHLPQSGGIVSGKLAAITAPILRPGVGEKCDRIRVRFGQKSAIFSAIAAPKNCKKPGKNLQKIGVKIANFPIR